MPRAFLPRFRHRRLPLLLALCAWLMLASMAWAQVGCCEGMPGAAISAMSMDGHAGMPGMDHHLDHSAGHAAGDCVCTHAPATLPGVAAVAMSSVLPRALGMAQPRDDAPQPPSKPPLRPPAA